MLLRERPESMDIDSVSCDIGSNESHATAADWKKSLDLVVPCCVVLKWVTHFFDCVVLR